MKPNTSLKFNPRLADIVDIWIKDQKFPLKRETYNSAGGGFYDRWYFGKMVVFVIRTDNSLFMKSLRRDRYSPYKPSGLEPTDPNFFKGLRKKLVARGIKPK